jgi:hypothetical protein
MFSAPMLLAHRCARAVTTAAQWRQRSQCEDIVRACVPAHRAQANFHRAGNSFLHAPAGLASMRSPVRHFQGQR